MTGQRKGNDRTEKTVNDKREYKLIVTKSHAPISSDIVTEVSTYH